MKSNYSVRKITTPAGSIRFEVSGYDAKGKQHRNRFKSEAEANGEIHRLEMSDDRVVNNSRVVQTRLTPEQVAEAERCFDRLPGNVTLTDAVDRIIGAWNKGERPLPMRDALVEYLDDMEERECRERSITSARDKIIRFIRENDFYEVPVDQIVTDDVKQWLKSLTPGSFNGHRLGLSGFWSFAVARKWCKRNIVSEITARKGNKARVSKRIEVLSIEQVQAMLRAAVADGKSLAWTATAIFGGLRPESELRYLTWDAVDFRGNNIYIERSKTESAERHVKMHPTLKSWLRLATGQNFNMSRADLKHVKRAAGYKSGLVRTEGGDDWEADQGLTPYSADITRHTFGSFLYGRELNYNEVADQMGNSASIVKRHYKKALPEEQVERFWNLTPAQVLGKKKLEAVG